MLKLSPAVADMLDSQKNEINIGPYGSRTKAPQ